MTSDEIQKRFDGIGLGHGRGVDQHVRFGFVPAKRPGESRSPFQLAGKDNRGTV